MNLYILCFIEYPVITSFEYIEYTDNTNQMTKL
jgi:hypothetical protein